MAQITRHINFESFPVYSAKPQLKQEFIFDNFIEGPSNEIAIAAAKKVSVSHKDLNNVLFLHSGSGLGKTHLMHAIGNEFLDLQPDKKVLYMTSEQYVRDMIDALRVGAMEHFQDHYQSADVLLVDDIQFIANKCQTQVELFHTFNALINRGKKIVLSCNRDSNKIEGLDDRLKFKFSQGLNVEIKEPYLDTRVAILQHKSYLWGNEISQKIAIYLAIHVVSEVRELEGILRRVFTFAKIKNRKITIALVDECMKDVFLYIK